MAPDDSYLILRVRWVAEECSLRNLPALWKAGTWLPHGFPRDPRPRTCPEKLDRFEVEDCAS